MLQPSPKHYDDHTPSGIHIQDQNLWDYLRLLGWNGLSPTMRLLCIRMMRCIGLSWGNVPGLSYVAWYNLILSEFMFFWIMYPAQEQQLGLIENAVYPQKLNF